jgi:hypothetical protein
MDWEFDRPRTDAVSIGSIEDITKQYTNRAKVPVRPMTCRATRLLPEPVVCTDPATEINAVRHTLQMLKSKPAPDRVEPRVDFLVQRTPRDDLVAYHHISRKRQRVSEEHGVLVQMCGPYPTGGVPGRCCPAN